MHRSHLVELLLLFHSHLHLVFLFPHALHGQLALVLKVLLQTHTHISSAARPTGAGIQGTPTDTHTDLMRCTANWRWYSRYSYIHTHISHPLHGQLALVFKVLLQTHTHISSAARPTGPGIQGTPTDIHRSHPLHGQLALVFKVLLQTYTDLMRCTANWRWYSRYSYRHTQISCTARPTGAGIQGTPTYTHTDLIRCTANWRWYSRYSYRHTHRSHPLHGQLALVFKVLLQTQTQISRTYSNEESKIIQIIENIQADQLRWFCYVMR